MRKVLTAPSEHESLRRSYAIISAEEYNAREARYYNRWMFLKPCLNIITEAIEEFRRIYELEDDEKKFADYLSTEQLPLPDKPAEIRTYFKRMRYLQKLTIQENIDYLLLVNEQSVLTHVSSEANLTRKNLMKTYNNDVNHYENDINSSLKVLKRMEDYLWSPNARAMQSAGIIEDLGFLLSYIKQQIRDFTLLFTYRILLFADTNMRMLCPRSSEYISICEAFSIHIWTVRNVPITFKYLQPQWLVNLHALNVTIQIPQEVLEINLTIHGVHYDFDHYSDQTVMCNRLLREMPLDEKLPYLPDLFDYLLQEYAYQVDLTTKARQIMYDKYADHKHRVKQLEKEASKIRSSMSRSFKLIVVWPKKPEQLTKDTYPDVYEEFLETNELEFIAQANLYHPSQLKLLEHELNIKQYYIINGTYVLDFVVKPAQWQFHNFNKSWHKDECTLDIRKDVVVNIKRMLNELPSKTRASIMDAVMITEEKSLKDVIAGNAEALNHLFIVKIKLPKHAVIGGLPLACHFELDGYKTVEPSLYPEPTKPTDTQFHTLSTIRSYSDSPHPSLNSLNTLNNVSQITLAPSVGIRFNDIDDFQLNFSLEKHNVDKIKRFCVPRMISSFTFPSESMDATKQSLKKRMISYRNARNSTYEEQLANKRTLYSKEEQNMPERIFPRFESLADHYTRQPKPHPEKPETFSDLISVMNNIRSKYIKKYEEILKVDIRNISQFKKKDRATLAKYRPIMRRMSTKQKTLRMSRWISSIMEIQRMSEREREYLKQKAKYERRERQSSVKSIITDSKSLFSNRLGEEPEESVKLVQYPHWTRKHIYSENFDKETSTLTVWTDRLGIIGIACKRYAHFPFLYWSLSPKLDDDGGNSNEIILTIDTQLMKCVFNVTPDGYKAYVTELTSGFNTHPNVYVNIDKPMSSLRDLKKIFREANVNIFPDHDARYYIENGYFSEKHMECEVHTYNCMVVNCAFIKFFYSNWNRLTKRRDIVLNIDSASAGDENHNLLVRITPEKATFVTIKEKCSDNYDEIDIEFILTWRNITSYVDLNQLVGSVFPSAPSETCKNAKLIIYLRDLLCAIRPLSFS